jgi:PKD repeat protein
MLPSRITRLLALALLASACSGHHENPVLPTDPGGTTGQSQYTVTVASDVSQLTAGATIGTALHISARHPDGTLPPDGAEVVVNTNIGSFGVDSAGKPVLLTRTNFLAGKAAVEFFAGSDAGVANILAQLGTDVGRLNLPIVAAPPAPVANFTFSSNGLTVLFTDASTGSPTSYHWQFGDGSESTDKSPTHTYTSAATYPVMLIVTNAGGQSSKSEFVTVSLGAAPQAAFDFQVVGQQANFVDRSTGSPTSWSWIFGDGGSSAQQNPIHTYTVAGPYTVSLTVRNSAGETNTSKVVTIAAGAAPVADFDDQAAGLQVNFVDRSTGAPTSWAWTFGDGGTSASQNPIHTYAAAGTYTVSLKATNASGSNSMSKVVSVTPGTAPVAKFAFTTVGNQVNFVDQSTGTPTSWSWTFGDGSAIDSSQNPVHTYAGSGAYTVTLKVTNAAGSNSTSQVVTIAAGTAPKADFTFTVSGLKANFLDRSTGSPTSWSWSFGDGSALDFTQNPVHTYAAAGTYTVVLTATNASGSTSKSDVVTVPSAPVANFDFTKSGLQVTFTDRSTANPTSWQWNFGDSTSLSAQQNPVHTYAAAGTYTVTLTAANAGGSSNVTKPVAVP